MALGAPYFKAVGMARGPLAAAMVGKNIGKKIENGDIPVYISRFGRTKEEIFVSSIELQRKFGSKFESIPTGAIGHYTYLKRLEQELKQLMCGSTKFALEYIRRDDIASLTKKAAEISGISYVMDSDKDEVKKILDS